MATARGSGPVGKSATTPPARRSNSRRLSVKSIADTPRSGALGRSGAYAASTELSRTAPALTDSGRTERSSTRPRPETAANGTAATIGSSGIARFAPGPPFEASVARRSATASPVVAAGREPAGGDQPLARGGIRRELPEMELQGNRRSFLARRRRSSRPRGRAGRRRWAERRPPAPPRRHATLGEASPAPRDGTPRWRGAGALR